MSLQKIVQFVIISNFVLNCLTFMEVKPTNDKFLDLNKFCPNVIEKINKPN
ncbi:hypothetical protein CFPU101_44650 [Chroococcus sp. FPU101]|nr:hypothetical protein CFPU101_44650 [Chroococcus sp. FPU101]